VRGKELHCTVVVREIPCRINEELANGLVCASAKCNFVERRNGPFPRSPNEQVRRPRHWAPVCRVLLHEIMALATAKLAPMPRPRPRPTPRTTRTTVTYPPPLSPTTIFFLLSAEFGGHGNAGQCAAVALSTQDRRAGRLPQVLHKDTGAKLLCNLGLSLLQKTTFRR